MATQVQRRRGTTAEHSTFTGAVGETTVDTSKDTVVVHDGSTQGGFPLLREDMSNNQTPSVDRITLSEYAEFDTGYTPTESEPQGALYWNPDERTLSLVTNGQTTEIGQKLEVECRNATGSTIARGVPVYASGTIGNSGRITVAPMIADGSIDANLIIGVTDEQILNGEDGKVVKVGKIRKIDTSAYSEGDVLYVSETSAGAWTSTKPSVPNISLPIAFVVTDSATVGEIFVRVEAIDENAFQPYDADLTTLATMGAAQALGLTGVSGTFVEFDTLVLDGDLTINGDTASDDYSAETTGWQIDSSGAADFRSIYADSIITQAFIAEVAQALAGEDFLTKSVTLLENDFTVPSATPSTTGIKVKPLQGISGLRVFEDDDWLRMRVVSSAQGLVVYDVYAKVVNLQSVDMDGSQNYVINVDHVDSGGGGKVINAGSLVLDYGQSGDYFIERSVLTRTGNTDYDKVPYDRIVQWTNTSGSGSPRAGDGATFTTISVVGNLGVYDGTYDGEFGFYSSKALLTDSITVGDLNHVNNFLRYEGQTFDVITQSLNLKGAGLQISTFDEHTSSVYTQFSGTTPSFVCACSTYSTGFLHAHTSVDGLLSEYNSYIALGEAESLTVGTGVYMTSDGEMRVGNPSGNYMKFDGTDLDIVSETFDLSTSTLVIDSTSNSIALGATPPTDLTGTGFYVDGSGDFLIGQGSGTSYMKFTSSSGTLSISASEFSLEATGLEIVSTSHISLGSATSLTAGDGIYMTDAGYIRFGEASGNNVTFDSNGLSIATDTFDLASGGIAIKDTGVTVPTANEVDTASPTSRTGLTSDQVINDAAEVTSEGADEIVSFKFNISGSDLGGGTTPTYSVDVNLLRDGNVVKQSTFLYSDGNVSGNVLFAKTNKAGEDYTIQIDVSGISNASVSIIFTRDLKIEDTPIGIDNTGIKTRVAGDVKQVIGLAAEL